MVDAGTYEGDVGEYGGDVGGYECDVGPYEGVSCSLGVMARYVGERW
jgi:hypothetical protein